MKYAKIPVSDEFEADVIIGDRGNDTTVWQPHYKEVLDHGFVGLVDFMGDDMAIVNAARVSYGKGTKKSSTDRGLIRYLMRHRHTTPFEMVEFKFHIKAPIFVFRQWHRHRTFSINEYSGRYSILDAEMYMPEYEDAKPQSRSNRQGRAEDLLTHKEYVAVTAAIDHIFEESYQTYKYLLGPNENGDIPPPPTQITERINWCKDAAVKAAIEARRIALESEKENPYPTEESVEELIRLYYEQNGVAVVGPDFPGLARELARMVLPVATYSQMYWKGNLHNLFHFLSLRCDKHAQKEILVYADAILEMIEPYVPWAVEAFRDYQLEGMHLSRMEVELLREQLFKLNSEELFRKLSEKGASKREVQEFASKLFPTV